MAAIETIHRDRIAVLWGGEPAERETALKTVEAVAAALRDRYHDAVAIHIDREIDVALRQEQVDVALLALPGRAVEGPVQGLLEALGIPYSGSSLAAAALAADKLRAKELLRLHNLPTPAYYRHARGLGSAVEQHQAFGYPCVVKPRRGSAGVGVALARNAAELAIAIDRALRLDSDVIVERFVAGREIQVALLDGQAIGAAELVTPAPVLDYAARRSPEGVAVVIPPRLGRELLRGVITQAVRIHHLLGCSGATRVDILVSDRGNETVLEIDTVPDLAPPSSYLKIAHAAGIDFGRLVERLVATAHVHRDRGFDTAPMAAWRHAGGRTGESIEPH